MDFLASIPLWVEILIGLSVVVWAISFVGKHDRPVDPRYRILK